LIGCSNLVHGNFVYEYASKNMRATKALQSSVHPLCAAAIGAAQAIKQKMDDRQFVRGMSCWTLPLGFSMHATASIEEKVYEKRSFFLLCQKKSTRQEYARVYLLLSSCGGPEVSSSSSSSYSSSSCFHCTSPMEALESTPASGLCSPRKAPPRPCLT